MTAILLMLAAIVVFYLGYTFYGNFISRKIDVNDNNITPSHTQYDGVDYVPARSPVLLGHHFASIAGAGPIVGPAIAVAFGWIPVYAWILFGAVFIGGVHDFTTIIASVRHKSKSIGQIIETYIGIPGKRLFLIFTWSTLILVIAVFAIIVVDTFISIPSVGTSSILFIVLAILFGITIYRLKVPLWIASIIGAVLLFLAAYAGQVYPISLSKDVWMIIIFSYIFAASVTPVWILLQPRDYLNSFFLYAILILGVLGIFFAVPKLNVPEFTQFHLDKVGFLFPALFVTVACGAISGFHSIVASGTTAKQLNKESDARLIGYGGMLLEGVLAVLAMIAVASLEPDVFMNTLVNEGPVAAFSLGVGNFISAIPILNISHESAQAFAALAVAAFALTTLDTATRLARYSFQEFFEISGKTESPKWNNRFTATAVSVLAGIALTFSGQTMAIWPIFGSANQMLAALALLTLTVWLSHLKKKNTFTIIPMYFMFAVTLSALFMLFLNNLIYSKNITLSVISLLLFILAIVLAIEAYNAVRKTQLIEKTIKS